MQPESSDTSADLLALLGSRLCHDLISPLGAIGNGIELLAMSGAGMSPELQLISESVGAANARLKFFRVAFGKAGADQRLGQPEILSLLAEVARAGRIGFDWCAGGDHARAQVRLVFLALLCLETALPYGGSVRIETDGAGGWRLIAEARRTRSDPELWACLDGNGCDLSPAQVQFPMLARAAAAMARAIRWSVSDTTALIEF